jgi:dienelactone hydrolase
LGQVVDIGNGVQAYVVQASTTTDSKNDGKCLLSFQDIFAYNSARHFPVVDQFATQGFTVVHVNFLGDDWYQGDFSDFAGWIQNHAYEKVIGPTLKEVVLPYIKTTLGYNTVGTIGFCYGSYMAFMAAADVGPVASSIVAGVGFHPSHKSHGMIHPDDPECTIPTARITSPQLFVPAGNDPDFVKTEGSIMKALKAPSKSVVFDTMNHGWVNRGDVSDPTVKEGVKAAIELAVTFLNEHVK